MVKQKSKHKPSTVKHFMLGPKEFILGSTFKIVTGAKNKKVAPAGNRTQGPTMATLDFTTKPLARFFGHAR
jgi:hypothetical protein